ncbi:DUF6456 domain-containing protein [Ruegeria sp. 2012CJ41-6]|uniref:DUF6456 domain-containing protein n=1 Tax=Ruegeria spongiae TaxID=2942209 RepID=A0ABT0PWU6_9RHOB|nr:DUF6456 domain-containing protein [Ruegeria spongiae]MCL6281977.1 DUF6456 domain-containing protein [Ruegeria spongiae]
MNDGSGFIVPAWVPEGARRYLAHTEAGHSIRELARGAGCHASTVLRQIRKVEMRRDDPLVDAALQNLATSHFPSRTKPQPTDAQWESDPVEEQPVDKAMFDHEAARVLRRLCETGAVLAVAEDMDKAVVVRDSGAANTRTAVVAAAIAQALALNEWISCDKPGRICRYRITAAGRAALGQLLAEAENRARRAREDGMAEAQASFAGPATEIPGHENARRKMRYGLAESPLAALARRKDRDGKPFLAEDLVRAGERLREDFELAQIGPNVAQSWEGFLTGKCGGNRPGDPVSGGSSTARDRVARALSDLGPGLSEVALRCCCYLEGLELAEKRLSWSARSGKIVLRIALQRLKRHYEMACEADAMIG